LFAGDSAAALHCAGSPFAVIAPLPALLKYLLTARDLDNSARADCAVAALCHRFARQR
jgi:hypothetical protein